MRKFNIHLSRRILTFGLILIICFSAIFYLVLGRGASSTISRQQLNRQQLIARAEASNIASFFQVFGDSIAVLAQSGSVQNSSSSNKASKDLDAFVEQWRDSRIIGGIVITDESGVVKFNSNVFGTHDIGADLSDRDYFKWGLANPKPDEYFVGNPVTSKLGASKGQTIVPVAVPIYNKDKFVGMLVASVKLHDLTEHYLGVMKVTESTDVFLIGMHGDLWYSNTAEDLVGTNVFKNSEKPFLSQELIDKFKKSIDKNEESSLQAIYLDPTTHKQESHLVAYSPIVLANRHWLLVLGSTSKETIGDVTNAIHIRQSAIIILFALTMLLFGLIVAREVRCDIPTPEEKKSDLS